MDIYTQPPPSRRGTRTRRGGSAAGVQTTSGGRAGDGAWIGADAALAESTEGSRQALGRGQRGQHPGSPGLGSPPAPALVPRTSDASLQQGAGHEPPPDHVMAPPPQGPAAAVPGRPKTHTRHLGHSRTSHRRSEPSARLPGGAAPAPRARRRRLAGAGSQVPAVNAARPSGSPAPAIQPSYDSLRRCSRRRLGPWLGARQPGEDSSAQELEGGPRRRQPRETSMTPWSADPAANY